MKTKTKEPVYVSDKIRPAYNTLVIIAALAPLKKFISPAEYEQFRALELDAARKEPAFLDVFRYTKAFNRWLQMWNSHLSRYSKNPDVHPSFLARSFVEGRRLKLSVAQLKKFPLSKAVFTKFKVY